MGRLLGDLKTKMTRKVTSERSTKKEDDEPLKLAVYSCHDTSLAGILCVLSFLQFSFARRQMIDEVAVITEILWRCLIDVGRRSALISHSNSSPLLPPPLHHQRYQKTPQLVTTFDQHIIPTHSSSRIVKKKAIISLGAKACFALLKRSRKL